jgi:Mg2+ and Co2+ transporter CorA
VKGTEARKNRVQEMSRLLSNLKQDMMNRTLYALTLVTFLSTPVALLTGTFGMNFDDMWELVGSISYSLATSPFSQYSKLVPQENWSEGRMGWERVAG